MAPKLLASMLDDNAKRAMPAPWEEGAEAQLVSESGESDGE